VAIRPFSSSYCSTSRAAPSFSVEIADLASHPGSVSASLTCHCSSPPSSDMGGDRRSADVADRARSVDAENLARFSSFATTYGTVILIVALPTCISPLPPIHTLNIHSVSQSVTNGGG